MAATGWRILRSTDGGAPQLTGQAGSVLAILRALLDTANSSGYWQEVFTGTNKAVFRAKNGDRQYLRVLDDPDSGRVAEVRGFTTMSDVDTGTNQFPTTAQQANYTWRKSLTSDATARSYVAICDSRTFYVWAQYGTPSGNIMYQDMWGFGEFIKLIPSKPGMQTFVMGSVASTVTSSNGALISSRLTNNPYATSNFTTGYYTPDNIAGTLGSVIMTIAGPTGSPGMLLSEGYDLVLTPLIGGSVAGDGNSSTDGQARGIYPYLRGTNIASNDPGVNYSGIDTVQDEDGKTYQLILPGASTATAANYVVAAFMISNTEMGVV